MGTVPQIEPSEVAALGERIAANVARAVKVPGETLRTVIVALLAEGHVLIEDNPGVGKTALARAPPPAICDRHPRARLAGAHSHSRYRRSGCSP